MSNNKIFIFIQYILPQHFLSRVMGIIANSKIKWFKNLLIGLFIRRYKVNMEEALLLSKDQYVNFNDFFTRPLKPNARIISKSENTIIVPADGQISQMGTIENNQLIQCKGMNYSTEMLLTDKSKAKLFENGSFATIYLSPKDYHRVHSPIDANVTEMVYVPGSLFSVNKVTTQYVDNLFTKNERVICFLETKIGPVALILVGAMIVASVEISWEGLISNPVNIREKVTRNWHYKESPININKGDEVGRFLIGSTVIILLPRDRTLFNGNLSNDSVVKVGEVLADIT